MNKSIDAKVLSLGLLLPAPFRGVAAGVSLPFSWVRAYGDRAIISGHLPLNPDGTLTTLLGKVGSDLSTDEAYLAARLTGLSILSSLQRELGSLDRITAWLRVFGMVNCAPGFTSTTSVVNGFSDLIIELFGPSIGTHARAAVGMAELPFGVPVEIEGEVAIRV